MIVLICGSKQSGKDTVGKILVNYYGFVRFSIATKIKEICRELFNVSVNEIHDEIPQQSRVVLQKVANAMRSIDQDVWINYLIKSMYTTVQQGKKIVVTDVRFEREIDKLKEVFHDVKIVVIKLKRRIDNDDDVTETSVDLISDDKVDYVVENQDWTYDYFFNYMFALCSRLGNL